MLYRRFQLHYGAEFILAEVKRKSVDKKTERALLAFTQRYCDSWYENVGSWPRCEALYGIPSPCIISSDSEAVIWRPRPFEGEQNINAVEQAVDIVIQLSVHTFYTTQFAGDMRARFCAETLTLVQTWSADDFRRLQENLIGHLVARRRRKLSPTLFIATLDSDIDIISVCNLSGEVIEERLGTDQRTVLAADVAAFLNSIEPVL